MAVGVVEFTISKREFELFRDLVRAHTGIALSAYKRPLLQARLGRRLRALGLATFTEYHRHLTEDESGQELVRFINAITTNKTDFFREAHHFDYLRKVWVPARRAAAAPTGQRTIRIWSAACSTGEEPYSIAITLLDALGPGAAGWDVKILASDIDTDVLDRAAAGVYPLEQTAPVPPDILARHFLRGTGHHAGTVRVRPALRDLVAFRRINFLDDPWPIRTRFDVVFCRNALIYFDRGMQQRLLRRLAGSLKDDGLLILGHSESAHGLLDGVQHLGNTIYRKVHDPAG
jgi:chemotaxis protein methyltransferase CheR